MAKRHFHLTSAQKAEPWRAYDKADDRQEQRRWQAVRLYGEGWTVSDIETATGCSETSLRRWAWQYRQGGIDGLRSQWRGGNRALLSQAQRAEIAAQVQQATPDQVLGSHQRRHAPPFWTVEDLQVLVEQ